MTTEVVVEPTEAERQAAAVAVAEKSREVTLEAGKETPVDAIVTTETEIAARPEGVPEKFYDAKTGVVDMTAWGKAHNELETKFHTKDADAGKTPEVIAAEKVIADAAAEAANVDATPVSLAEAEYAKDGKLSDETYANLAKAGVSKEMVEAHIETRKAANSAVTSVAFEAAGSEEKYGELVTWASTNLSAAEIAAYDAQVSTNDPEVIKLATTALAAKFAETAPVDGTRLDGGIIAASAGVFESKAEMTAAMNVPSKDKPGKTQYEVDPAYRASVQKKIIASRKAGNNIFL